MLVFPLIILLTIVSSIFVIVNFIAFLVNGRVLTRRKWWNPIQVWSVTILPALFLCYMDLSERNDCCSDSAVFSPQHRPGIYVLLILYTIAYNITVFKKGMRSPIAEILLNILLVAGLVLNILLCIHLTTSDDGYIWWIFGNLPVIMLLLIAMAENHQLLKSQFAQSIEAEISGFQQFSRSLLVLNHFLKYPVLLVLVVPIVLLLSSILLLFGQKPDSLVRAFTDTYKHGFSQLDYLCDNVQCGGHFLCSVGANGHKCIVRPVRYGERNGNRIICNRQLLVSNAFEDLLQEKLPAVHELIRKNYNKVGNMVHKHYHVFNIKIISDTVYLLMKPAELLFIIVLYTFDQKPENRIAVQYLTREDREKIKRMFESDTHVHQNVSNL